MNKTKTRVFFIKETDEPKIVCPKCGAVWLENMTVSYIDTAYHLWTEQGYKKILCPACIKIIRGSK